jgi:hypothetical protein
MLYTKLKHRTTEIKELTVIGLIDPVWIRNLKIFEEFHELRAKKVCVYCCYEFLAEDHKISWQSIKKIISDLSK